MKSTLLAGAFALALSATLPVLTTQVQATELSNAGALTQVNVSRIRAALKLTPDQQGYWPPIEAALRDIQRQQADPAGGGLLRRISNRVIAIALNSSATARLAAAARPLVRVLSDEQRQTAISLAHEMGLGPMLAAL
jgi:hypothetical protein